MQTGATLFLSCWEPSDSTIDGTLLLQEQPQQSPYSKNAMDWGKNEENATSGSYSLITEPLLHIDNDTDNDQEALDRVILLVKKYAADTVNFTKEDNTRLEMINQKMDLKYPKYSARDWELLEEAKTLVNELSKISGVEN